MAFVIIEWNGDPETASIIFDHRGIPQLFCDEQEAQEYAGRELGFDFKVIEIDKRIPKSGLR